MTSSTSVSQDDRNLPKKRGLGGRGWLIVIAATLAVHLMLFLFFKLEYLEVLRSEPPGDEGSSDFVFIDQPFALVPYPDFPQAVMVDEPASDIEEEERERSVLDEIGEPSLTIDPIQSGGGGGGAEGRPGPRSTTVTPQILKWFTPALPDGIDNDTKATVGLLLYVNVSGMVEDVKIARSAGIDELDRAAIDAAWNFRFIPGEIKGVPTAMWVRMETSFRSR
jgi:TonB family protein